MSDERHEVLTTRIRSVADQGAYWEVLMLASPVRYRLPKEGNAELEARLEQAAREGSTLEVLVDWERAEVVGVSAGGSDV